MKKPKKMPDWLARLREKDPCAFIEACRRGGKQSAKVRHERRQTRLAPSKRKLSEAEILADFEELKALEAARYAAWQRRDYLLPPEDNDLGDD